MARMKNRGNIPPGGWQYLQPQSGRQFAGLDIYITAQEVLDHRKANPFMCQQHGLSLDLNTIMNEIDEYTAAACLAHPGWEQFVGDTNPPKTWSPSALPRRLLNVAGAAGAVKRTASGLKLVIEWVGAGLKPVPHELAEKRSNVCANCPMNQDPNWLQRVDAAIASQIKSLVEVKNDLKLFTTNDAKLYTCSPCDCYLPLKVHSPINHIVENTSAEVMAKLEAVKTNTGEKCWVISEKNG